KKCAFARQLERSEEHVERLEPVRLMEHRATISLSPAPLSSLSAHDILQWLRLKIAQALRRGSIRESSSYPSARRHKSYPSRQLSPCPERPAEFYAGHHFWSRQGCLRKRRQLWVR